MRYWETQRLQAHEVRRRQRDHVELLQAGAERPPVIVARIVIGIGVDAAREHAEYAQVRREVERLRQLSDLENDSIQMERRSDVA